MTTARPFHLGDVLSVTTGRLLSPRHMDGIYDILNWMTGDNLFTDQLLRAQDECQGPLLAQHRDLAGIEVPDFGGDKDAVGRWLAGQVARFGEYRDVAPLAAGDHTRIDPIEELRMMRPDMPVTGIVMPEGEVPS